MIYFILVYHRKVSDILSCSSNLSYINSATFMRFNMFPTSINKNEIQEPILIVFLLSRLDYFQRNVSSNVPWYSYCNFNK